MAVDINTLAPNKVPGILQKTCNLNARICMFLVMTSVDVWFSQHHTMRQLLLTCGTKGLRLPCSPVCDYQCQSDMLVPT